MRVWPFVVRFTPTPGMSAILSGEQGFVYPSGNTSHGVDTRYLNDPLPSLSLSSLTVSEPDVATVFHLPLSALTASARLRPDMFRATNPY